MTNETNAPAVRPDPLDQPYCCFTCSHKFRLGEAIGADILRCPKCRSADMHPINQGTVELTKYHGDIGTRN